MGYFRRNFATQDLSGLKLLKNMSDAEFLQAVKRSILQVDPQAEVWLFGSRARGDAREDSDWDFLVLTDRPAEKSLKEQIRDNLYEVEFFTNKMIGSIIHSKQEWNDDFWVTPLYRNTERDRKPV